MRNLFLAALVLIATAAKAVLNTQRNVGLIEVAPLRLTAELVDRVARQAGLSVQTSRLMADGTMGP